MVPSLHLIGSILCALLGLCLLGLGLSQFGDGNPVLGAVLVVVGAFMVWEGRQTYHHGFVHGAWRARLERLGDPTGMSLNEVRRAIGEERDFRKTEGGSERTWRSGGVSLTLGFDADKVCTGVVASRGIRGRA